MSAPSTTLHALLEEAARDDAAGVPAARATALPRLALGLALAHAALALLSLLLGQNPGSVATIWYANAGVVAVVAFRPYRDWPVLLLAVGAANLAANLAWGAPARQAFALLLPNLIEIALGAWALQRGGLARHTLRSARQLLWLLLLGGVLPQLAGASVATLVLAGSGMDPLAGVWLPWFEGSVIGAISVLPLAFLLCRLGAAGLRQALPDGWLLVLLPLSVGVTLLAMAHAPFPFVFLSMPLLLAAVMVEMAAALLLTLVVSLTMAGAMATGVFVAPPLAAAWEQVFVYLALAGSLVPAQLLAAARAELSDSHARLAARTYELRRANDGLEQFVRIASHDLREPLNTVVQFGELLEHDEGPRLPPEGRQYLGLVLQAARRMRGLLDDVLQYARLQRHPQVEARALPLGPLFNELRDALAGRIRASSARLHIDPLPSVRGNPTMLSLLFQNLLSNALKFVPPGRAPQVHVVARVEGEMAWITIVDNGIGIEPENLPKLFQPFQRLQLRRLYEGTGLGLALARQIAEAHGGEIVVASVPGEGSRFSVRLPLA